jgi:hypothetical protein
VGPFGGEAVIAVGECGGVVDGVIAIGEEVAEGLWAPGVEVVIGFVGDIALEVSFTFPGDDEEELALGGEPLFEAIQGGGGVDEMFEHVVAEEDLGGVFGDIVFVMEELDTVLLGLMGDGLGDIVAESFLAGEGCEVPSVSDAVFEDDGIEGDKSGEFTCAGAGDPRVGGYWYLAFAFVVGLAGSATVTVFLGGHAAVKFWGGVMELRGFGWCFLTGWLAFL